VNVLMTSRSYLGLGFLGILSQLGDRSVACIGSPATQKRSVLFNQDPDYAIPDLSLQLPTLTLVRFCASIQVPQTELNFHH
jgi:hypothetical protein